MPLTICLQNKLMRRSRIAYSLIISLPAVLFVVIGATQERRTWLPRTTSVSVPGNVSLFQFTPDSQKIGVDGCYTPPFEETICSDITLFDTQNLNRQRSESTDKRQSLFEPHSLIATQNSAGTIMLQRAGTGKLLRSWRSFKPQSQSSEFTFSADWQILAELRKNKDPLDKKPLPTSLVLWNTNDGTPRGKLILPEADYWNSPSWIAANGKMVAFEGGTSGHSEVRCFDMATGQEWIQDRYNGITDSIDIETKRGLLACIHEAQSSAVLYDMNTGKGLWHKKTTGNASITFNPDGTMLALSDSKAGKIWLLATKTGAIQHTLAMEINQEKSNQTRIRTMFSPDGKTLVVISADDKKISLWDTAIGKLLRRLPYNGSAIWGINVSPDGTTLATLSDNLILSLWRLK